MSLSLLLPGVDFLVNTILNVINDMEKHPKKYFKLRLVIIETKLIELTCIVKEDIIRP